MRCTSADKTEWIHHVPFGLGHLLPLAVAHEAVHVDGVEGRLARQLVSVRVRVRVRG